MLPAFTRFCRTLREQLDSPLVALRDTLTVLVENPKAGHGICQALTNGLFVPLGRLHIALRDALAKLVTYLVWVEVSRWEQVD